DERHRDHDQPREQVAEHVHIVVRRARSGTHPRQVKLRNHGRMSVAARRERAAELAALWGGRGGRIPGIRTLITGWYRIEVVDRSMAIGAQGLLAVLPMLVVLGAFLPHDAALTLYEQVSDTVGLQRQQSAPLGSLMTEGQSSVNAGFIGVLIALVSAT